MFEALKFIFINMYSNDYFGIKPLVTWCDLLVYDLQKAVLSSDLKVSYF